MRISIRATVSVFGVLAASAQLKTALTLEQAVERAIRNHPAIASASLNAEAAATVTTQVRAAAQPVLTANLTSVGADRDTAIAAGTIQTSGLASRAATGLGFSQLVTDFGRTSKLVDSARLRAAAQTQNVTATRAQVALQVHQAYYSALAADAVLKVAQARVSIQQLTLRQVKALAESDLRSTLDVSFAEVALSEAELALYQAENSVQTSNALLAAAMGDAQPGQFTVADVPVRGRINPDPEAMVAEALRNRPELSVARLNESAARRTAEAERKLRYPVISLTGVVGTAPFHQRNFANQYGAAGLNVSIPLLNSALTARTAEAEFRARGVEKDEQALGLQIAVSVRVAWFEADNAWRRFDVTTKLVDQTAVQLRLANARYEAGLSGILELTQAQVSQTSAQVNFAKAKYDYLLRLSILDFTIGALL